MPSGVYVRTEEVRAAMSAVRCYHAMRDAYLLQRFGLGTVRFDEVEIRRMTKERAA